MLILTGRLGLDLTTSDMVLPMTIIGIGLGLFTGQVVDLAMSAVPESYSDVSSGVINSLSQLGYAFGTAAAGSIQLASFYGSVVNGVTQVANGPAVSGDTQRQLIVKLQDAVETNTQAQQQAFLSGLPPATQQQITQIFQDAMVTAQQDVLVLIVLFILVTLFVSSFLPLKKPQRGGEPEPTTAPQEDETASPGA
jgi:hypothetical protein